MTEERKRIPFAEFAGNLRIIMDQVIHEHETIVVEDEQGDLVEIRPATGNSSRRRPFTAEDDEAFLAAAGGWSDVDIDAFLKDIYESRQSSRPPVEL
jgi:hypothetical protein